MLIRSNVAVEYLEMLCLNVTVEHLKLLRLEMLRRNDAVGYLSKLDLFNLPSS